MEEFSKKLEDRVSKFYKTERPYYQQSIKELGEKHLNCIRHSVIVSKESIPEEDIIGFFEQSFGDKFKKPYSMGIADIERNMRNASQIFKGIKSTQDFLEEILRNAENYNNGYEENPDLIFYELVDYKRKRWKNG